MSLHSVMFKLERSVRELEIDFPIPEYLQNDIAAFIKGMNEKDWSIDCLMNEIQGSINMAMMSGTITKTQADLLREYYLYGGVFDESD